MSANVRNCLILSFKTLRQHSPARRIHHVLWYILFTNIKIKNFLLNYIKSVFNNSKFNLELKVSKFKKLAQLPRNQNVNLSSLIN